MAATLETFIRTHESQRLDAVERLSILDTPPEPAFDRITRMAARLFGVPIALITLVTEDRQWFKSRVGLDVCETSRGVAFCAHAIESDEVFVVPDATQDSRFVDNALVTGEPYIRFYAGAPLRTEDGFNLGTLCVIDTQPREFDRAARQNLSDLAALTVDEMELRRASRQLRESEARFKSAFALSATGMALVAPDGRWMQVNQRLCDTVGYTQAEMLPITFQDITHPDDLDLDLGQVRRLLAGEIASYEMEKRYRHKDGRWVWVLLSVALVRRGEDGGKGKNEPLYFVSQVQDITARKRAEEESRQAAQRVSAILESIKDSFFSLDREWRFTYANAQAERLLRRSKHELLGRSIWEVFPQRAGLSFEREYRRALESGQPVTFEEFLAEHRAWVEVHAYPSEEGLSVYLTDISARKAAESALRESEVRKAAILDTALDCILSIDHQGRVLEWNPAAEKTFGWARAEAHGKYLHDMIVPPELREAHARGISKYLETGHGPALGRRLELPAVRRNGERITVELAIIPVPGAEPPIFTGHLRDITRRQADEKALRESEARYGRIASNVPGMVYQFVLRPDGSVEFPFVSEGCRDIYGLEPREVEADATLLTRLILPEDSESFRSSVAESARTLSPWKWTGRIALPSGEQKWIEGASRPKREENGDILWDGLLLDVTQRKAAEAALQSAKHEAERLREEAEHANAAKSEFLGRMSHELRTPLNAILGFGQLLEISELDEGDRESVGHIVGAGRHLLGLINEVLDIARIESGHERLSVEPVSLNEMCVETLELVRPLAAQSGVEIVAHEPTACGCYVLADRQRLKQVLLNLLSNAIKYNRAGGSMRLECAPHEPGDKPEDEPGTAGRVRLLVHDTGPGIAPEMLERLFTPFDRLGAEQSGIEGTGVGLALSRRLVELMDGTISVRSQEGRGSTFEVELPLAESPLRAALGQDEPGEDEASRRLSRLVNTRRVILYIEDNLSNLQLVQCLLAPRPEIKLLTAMQGAPGLELARQHRPDLILLDLHLPDMDGPEVLRRLQSEAATRHIPIVVVSADATPGQIQRLLGEGARDYLTKPFPVRDFWRVLNDNLPPKPMPHEHADDARR